MNDLFNTVKCYSDDISIDFEFDKCPKVTFTKGKNTETHSIDLDITINIRKLEQAEAYRYLGIREGDRNFK